MTHEEDKDLKMLHRIRLMNDPNHMKRCLLMSDTMVCRCKLHQDITIKPNGLESTDGIEHWWRHTAGVHTLLVEI